MSLDVVHKVGPLALPPPAKAVLLVLAVHANTDGSNCYPSVERLCTFTSYRESAIYDALKQLLALKLIGRVQAPARGGYAIDLDMVAQLQPSGDAGPPEASAEKSAQRTRTKRTPVRSADSKVRAADSKVHAAESGVHSADRYIKTSESPRKTFKEESAQERAAAPDPKPRKRKTAKQKKPTKAEIARELNLIEARRLMPDVPAEDLAAWIQGRIQKDSLGFNHVTVKLIREEAAKAGITAARAVEIAAGRGWVSFEAHWLLKDRHHGTGSQRLSARAQTIADALPGIAARPAKPKGQIDFVEVVDGAANLLG